MAIETPYGKPTLLSGAHAATRPQPHDECVETANHWLFPPLRNAPQGLYGQRMLNSGSLERTGWEIGWAQIVGRRHRLCEDSMGVAWSGGRSPASSSNTAEHAIALTLADGVGGGARGEIASC